MVKTISFFSLLISLGGCAWVGDNSDHSPGLFASPSRSSLSTPPRMHPATARRREADVRVLDEKALTGTESMMRATELIDQSLKEGAAEKAPTALHDARYYLQLARETARQIPNDGQKIAWAGDDALFFAKRLLARTRDPQERAAPPKPLIVEPDASSRPIPIGWILTGIAAFLIVAGFGRRLWRMTTPVSRATS